MNELTLIQLISEQTMQNLLPVLALRPRNVVQVRSRGERFQNLAKYLERAIDAMKKTRTYASYEPEFFEMVINEDQPSMEGARRKVGESLSLWPGAVVNLTGGTKLMAIGAWRAAEYQGEPVLYCDTVKGEFVLSGKGVMPELPRFSEVAAGLTVEAVMACHGTPFEKWKSEKPTGELLEFARAARGVQQAAGAELLSYGDEVRRHFRCEKDRIPKSASGLGRLAEAPLPEPASSGVKEILTAAVRAKLLRRKGENFFPACEPSRGEMQRLANLLNGSWLELYVFDLLAGPGGDFADVQWSVEPVNQDEASFGETDVVCVNTRAAGLQIVSCKMGRLSQPLEHLAGLAQRRRDLGGSHARATLAVAQPEKGQIAQLKSWGALLNVGVLAGDEIENGFGTERKTA